jgi:hypothetical protein
MSNIIQLILEVLKYIDVMNIHISMTPEGHIKICFEIDPNVVKGDIK